MEKTKENIETLDEDKTKEKCSCNECNCKDEKKEHKQKENKKDKRLKEELTKRQDEIKKLSEENKTLLEKIKLSQAELVNYRKRKDEETEGLLKFANQDLIMELLPVVDNFERAIKLDDNDLTDELSKFLDGFKMMYASLTEILKKFGVEEINRVGEIFDPNQEQALLTDCVEDMEDDTVIEVLLKGYKYKGRVIRPASVKINQK